MSQADRPPVTELASAALDGEIADHERALLEADPDAAHATALLGQIRAAVRDTALPEPDAARKEEALAAALGAFDGVVVPLHAVPTHRRRKWVLPAVFAVAAALVLAIGVMASRQDTGGSPDFAASAPTTALSINDQASTTKAAPAGAAATDASGGSAATPPSGAGGAAETAAATAGSSASSPTAPSPTATGRATDVPPPATTLAPSPLTTAAPTAPETTIATDEQAVAVLAGPTAVAAPTCPPPAAGAVFHGTFSRNGGTVEAFSAGKQGWLVAVPGCTVMEQFTLP
jgi:hypothetical protein